MTPRGCQGVGITLTALVWARCLIDTQPRRLTVEDYRVLNNCAEMVVRRLEREVFSREHMGAAHQVRQVDG